jgi:hypothetical protein
MDKFSRAMQHMNYTFLDLKRDHEHAAAAPIPDLYGCQPNVRGVASEPVAKMNDAGTSQPPSSRSSSHAVTRP